MRLKKVSVMCGKGKIAFLKRNGILHIWVGKYVKRAHPDARQITITAPCLLWGMEDDAET